MKEELDKKLVEAFPLLYTDRHGDIRKTLMPFGFECGSGWFDIIWDLSSKLEPIIQKFIDENPNLECSNCWCKKDRHYGCLTPKPGKCSAISVDPYSEEEPPGNYRACHCDRYISSHPKAVQVKEKFASLRFYLSSGSPEMFALIDEASTKTGKTCEVCGQPGKVNEEGYWLTTLCELCRDEQESA